MEKNLVALGPLSATLRKVKEPPVHPEIYSILLYSTLRKSGSGVRTALMKDQLFVLSQKNLSKSPLR